MTDPKEFIKHIVSALVAHPEDIEIKTVDGERTTIIELKVNNEDIGKVIGKGGQVARAMRTLLTAATSRDGKRYNLEILD